MKPQITVLTLGVSDLGRALAFYRDGLGLPTKGIIGQEFEHGAVAFFDLSGGLKLALWAQADIAHDTGLPLQPVCPTAFTIGHNVARREEVAEVMEAAAQAGAQIVKPAQDTFWGGHAGYFRDPDGHLWEIVWNPHLLPPED
ncbi:VOC family protein [Pseudotabrizicola algicola]|uniref:VOC family protein n=1 Tax=Pseudotabrizicola algicola TaxID=2709381 RepID=A0A6B3RLF4_9RHOB|nr:VOC family protein [Pseudotabrizicola algicola]NEX45973.1 VOC family protein [Pseudotabrizicola algicola]